MTILSMTDLDLKGKRLLIREDFNVPVKDGKVTSDARIQAALPTIRRAIESGAQVMLLSHLGRPQEGIYDESASLAPVAARLSELLGQNVALQKDWLDGVALHNGEAVLCENVRFNPGEKANDESLARKMAALCDIFVMDAFGTAHRAQASTHGVARFAPIACAGPLLTGELEALGRAMENPEKPLIAIVGGAKVSTKLELLESLAHQVDQLILGGGIANTFLAAAGKPVGKSLYEPDLMAAAQRIAQQAHVPLPVDLVVAKTLSADAQARICDVDDVAEDDMILDVGPKTAHVFAALAKEARTIVWNGPLGVFEYEQFSAGTRELAEAIAQSQAFSIAGGGDTLAALEKFGIADKVSYISTGGGAFLEFLEGKTLPAVAVLEERAREMSR